MHSLQCVFVGGKHKEWAEEVETLADEHRRSNTIARKVVGSSENTPFWCKFHHINISREEWGNNKPLLLLHGIR